MTHVTRNTQDTRGKQRDKQRVLQLAACSLLLLIAAAFRFYALPDLPLGLDQDEIINAIAIRGIMAGERPIFITAGWGREPVYAYRFRGERYDAGNKLEYLIATVDFALKRPDMGKQFREYLKSLKL